MKARQAAQLTSIKTLCTKLDLTHEVQIASTGSAYVEVIGNGLPRICIRIADHGEAYRGSTFSIAPDGHSIAQVKAYLHEAAKIRDAWEAANP